MNERIRELAEQANNAIGGNAFSMARYNEKFAELIVRECCLALWTEECHTSDLALEEFEKNSKKIKQHFGVEE